MGVWLSGERRLRRRGVEVWYCVEALRVMSFGWNGRLVVHFIQASENIVHNLAMRKLQ
jgi:hypothetical protein